MNKGTTPISAVHNKQRDIISIRRGLVTVWEYIRSCFGRGFWVNDRPWRNEDGWKNSN